MRVGAAKLLCRRSVLLHRNAGVVETPAFCLYLPRAPTIPQALTIYKDDNGDMAAWARNAVAFMNDKGIVTGIGGNNFGRAPLERVPGPAPVSVQ